MTKPAWIWLVYATLFSASIPWYLSPTDGPAIWLGLPHWVVISLLSCLGIAVFTAFVIWRYWPVSGEDDPEPPE